MRKIYADELLKTLCENCLVSDDCENHMLNGKECNSKRLIDSIPSIEEDTICECNRMGNADMICRILNADKDGKVCDVIEPIRCEKCELWNEKATEREYYGYCVAFDHVTRAAGYCYLGREGRLNCSKIPNS